MFSFFFSKKMLKTSVLSISKFFKCGEREVIRWVKMVKRGFFSPEIIFFRFLKEKKIQNFWRPKFWKICESGQKCPNLGQICVNFGQNRSFLNFRQKSETVIFFRLQRLGFVQKNRKFQCAVFEKNAKNLSFRLSKII